MCAESGPDVPTETASVAEVVEWQTRTFEGRVAQAVRVQVPPSAPNPTVQSRAQDAAHIGH
ncbi:hypothetical protein NSPZN2_11076 [Nitrospira defluvii]|uniref:Uncharacterized protein n=1 Tax=Nitrospira defluvii TaxID=330214 RepID=A0ABM8QPC4_9BACT|nr:hypothetical protein NSPZN2_11076 [Nitrospira defluvii]